MRRTDRLFEIILMVRDQRLHRAQDIAERLEVSVRTIYRDIETLVASGVPIEGARGLGYLLREPIFLPPLTLSEPELEALHFGLAVVAQAAEPTLQQAARSLQAKIEAAIPPSRQVDPASWGVAVHAFDLETDRLRHLSPLKRALRERRKLAIAYRSLEGQRSERIIRPLQLEFWGKLWTLTSWCEARQDFRVFRIDRIEQVEVLEAPFADEPGRRLVDYLARIRHTARI